MRTRWRKEKCVSCSLCIVLCPYDAFQPDKEAIEYIHHRCADCENCIARVGCPRRAII